ncbi:hypothetical protein PTSG_01313 [Salpingoeca rosetta]|uniref:Uncharacterized protein n=1 Tax=Salpingoeca rosetta (strain ATCC 50818 / BSB-021) TaxID=946362 RepID=F2TZZ6_SALR5|nr:uncharacterized protein PTSG_01313 [Salpingoeca rosetta]EGD80724.1 hypothetical protein PTSG_01313 [Salpingoeca rosetta]|eukprot:XP_004997285.1 hypothetical protein PTSG_01313 [Salpingoeca rosetta]
MSGWLTDLLLLGEDEEERMERLRHEEAVRRQQEEEQEEQEDPQGAKDTQHNDLNDEVSDGDEGDDEGGDGRATGVGGKSAARDDTDDQVKEQQETTQRRNKPQKPRSAQATTRTGAALATGQQPHSPHRTLAEDIEHELDEIAAGFMSFVGQARSFGTSLIESAGETLKAFDSGMEQLSIEERLDPRPIRLLTVGIMGSGTDSHAELACPLAQWLAKRGYNLLTGGGRGVMQAASKAFVSVRKRHGRCVGVVRSSEDNRTPYPGYPNPYVEIPIITHLAGKDNSPQSRNHINILTSDIIVCLPGSKGTASELALSALYDKPVCVFSGPTKPPPAGAETLDVPVYTQLEEVQAFILQESAKLQREEQRKQRRLLQKEQRQQQQRDQEDAPTHQRQAHAEQTAESAQPDTAATVTPAARASTSTKQQQQQQQGRGEPGISSDDDDRDGDEGGNDDEEGEGEGNEKEAEGGEKRAHKDKNAVPAVSGGAGVDGAETGAEGRQASKKRPAKGEGKKQTTAKAKAKKTEQKNAGKKAPPTVADARDADGDDADVADENDHDDSDGVVVVDTPSTTGARARASVPDLQLPPHTTTSTSTQTSGEDEEPVLSPAELQELRMAMQDED